MRRALELAGVVIAVGGAGLLGYVAGHRASPSVADRALIEVNHPGPVDPQGVGFRDWLARGYTQAVARSRQVRSFGGYHATLAGFAEGFRDGHLGLWPSVERQQLRTPGFIVGLRDGAIVVCEAGPAGPPIGTELVSCDGEPVAALLARDVFPFHQHGPDLEATRISAAPWLLIDDDNPFRKRPGRCRVKVLAGESEIVLAWADRDVQGVRAAAQRAAFGAEPRSEIRELGDGGLWVSIPRFWGDAEQERYFRRMIAEAPSWRTRPRIVLDVRGKHRGQQRVGHADPVGAVRRRQAGRGPVVLAAGLRRVARIAGEPGVRAQRRFAVRGPVRSELVHGPVGARPRSRPSNTRTRSRASR